MEPPHELLKEFHGVMNDIAGAHAMSLFGILKVAEWARDPGNQPPNLGPESTLSFGHGNPNVGGMHYQRWHWSTLQERLEMAGPIARQLGQQWLVMVVSQWEDHFRLKLAQASGMTTKNEFKDPVFADLNRMRNDVVHHGGIATKHNTGKCEELPWFEPGEHIHVLPAHVADFMAYLGLEQAASEIGDPGSSWVHRS